MKADILVLGAGIVGTSAALHLALRGRSVVVVDRRGPGEETSYGNSGVVGRSGVTPMAFPRSASAFMKVVRQRYPGAHYHAAALPGLAPWLFAYFRASEPSRMMRSAERLAPLTAASIDEHRHLASLSGAEHLYRDGGWMKVYRSAAGFDAARRGLEVAHRLGLDVDALDRDATLAAEPHLQPIFSGATLWNDVRSVSDPGGVVTALASVLPDHGAALAAGDARSLRRDGAGWTVDGAEGPITAREAVVALGPWSADILAPLGYRVPLAAKRGYHRHYAPKGNATLSRPVLDEERGYVMSPMDKGIRVTTGSEFAKASAPPTPVQLEAAERDARELFPIDAPREAAPWMGARPCLPDMLPMIGRAPKHPGLWFAFGHQHNGFTLGPPTGRLLAEMMTGEAPFVDPTPYRTDRF